MAPENPGSLTRRNILRGSLAAVAGPCLCAATRSDCCTAVALSPSSVRFEDGLIHIDLKQAPDLAAPGGSARIVDERRSLELIVVHSGKREFAAADPKCTHGNGALAYVPKRRLLQCTCWGHSQFGLDGAILAGPAKKKLRIYETSLAGHILTIRKETRS